MGRIKRIAVIAIVVAFGMLGAAEMSSAATSSATPNTVGTHHSAAAGKNSVAPLISTRSCSDPSWGVQVWTENWGSCTAYGFTGTTGYLGYYSAEMFTNNNYGWVSYNKDLVQHTQEHFNPCTDFQWFTGQFSTAQIQYIHIDGWVPQGTC